MFVDEAGNVAAWGVATTAYVDAHGGARVFTVGHERGQVAPERIVALLAAGVLSLEKREEAA
jgi:4-aminobutyrate aminotransferase-like enzyme